MKKILETLGSFWLIFLVLSIPSWIWIQVLLRDEFQTTQKFQAVLFDKESEMLQAMQRHTQLMEAYTTSHLNMASEIAEIARDTLGKFDRMDTNLKLIVKDYDLLKCNEAERKRNCPSTKDGR